MTDATRPDNTTPAEQPKHPWNDTLKTLVYAIVLALFLRSFFFEPFHIPSSSMKDTLLIGDYLFVSKYSYGYSRFSFPLGLPLFKGRMFESAPKRGDVVVFRPPGSPHIDFIKRLIGLPGDRIQMKDGELYINDSKVSRTLEDIYTDDENGTKFPVKRYIETLPGGRAHDVLDRGPAETDGMSGINADNTPVYTVPEGHYFVMGDNRDNSKDSRFPDPVGFVPAENLIGRAEVILFSIGGDSPFWQIWTWPTSIRFNRFFHGIQ